MNEDYKELLIRIDEKLEHIHRAIYGGNGTQGLLARVDNLEAWRNRIMGGLGVLSFIVVILLSKIF